MDHGSFYKMFRLRRCLTDVLVGLQFENLPKAGVQKMRQAERSYM
jgi:hypothetical protein